MNLDQREALAKILCDADALNGSATWDEADEGGRDDYRRMADAALGFLAGQLEAAAEDLVPISWSAVRRVRDRAAAVRARTEDTT